MATLPFLILLLMLLISFLVITHSIIISGSSGVRRLFFDMLRNPSQVHDIVTTRLKRYGGTVNNSTYLFMTSDPRNAQHVFSKRHSNFPKGPEYKDKFSDGFGDGIFSSDGELGLSQRRFLHSFFTSMRFEHVLATTLRRKIESGLVPVLDRAAAEAMELDLQDVFKRFMFDSICTTVLGFDPNYLTVDLLPDLPYAKAYDVMGEAAFHRQLRPNFWWKFERFFRIGEERTLAEARDKFDQFLYTRIKIMRANFQRKNEKSRQFNLLTSFMEATGDETIVQLTKSDKFLRDTAFTMIGAGRDTVSATLAWLIWLIISNPNVGEKIVDEIRANLGEKNGHNWRMFKEEEVNKLVLLHGAMCEALRLYPPVPVQYKTAVEADTLPSGHTVGKGAKVMFSTYAMGRMEEIWGQDWMEFKPERWISSDGNKILHYPSYKFMAFAAGPRACLGKNMTFVYVKQVACALLYNYKVEMVGGHEVVPMFSILLFIKDGLKVRVSKRN
ncbi:Noroxomaritidine synthase 3 [Linum perenne]